MSSFSNLQISSGNSASELGFVSNGNPHEAYLRSMVQKIDDLAQDVEMQAPLSELSTYLVVDTNVVLHHLDVMKQFLEDAERHQLPVIIVIPGVVVFELDSQKNREGLAWSARRATTWILQKVRERNFVKVQANEETCRPSGNWKVAGNRETTERKNDMLILDCCHYFRQKKRTYLCSSDKNLLLEAMGGGKVGFERESKDPAVSNIPGVEPTRNWSSREIVSKLWEGYVDIRKFRKYQPSYQMNPSTEEPDRGLQSIDAMEVDDDEGPQPSEGFVPSHPLDALHLQVIDHFTRLLVDLVGRVGGPEIYGSQRAEGSRASRHAPQWKALQQPYVDWRAEDLLAYLDDKKKLGQTQPVLAVFLSQPYTRGGRRGQDWSREAWNVGLGALEELGREWEEIPIRMSLWVLRGHVDNVFSWKLRPTG